MPKLTEELNALEHKMTAPGFWDSQSAAKKVIDRANVIKKQIEPLGGLESRVEDFPVLIELAKEQGDVQSIKEVQSEFAALEKAISTYELDLLLSGPFDRGSAFMTIHAGAGGTAQAPEEAAPEGPALLGLPPVGGVLPPTGGRGSRPSMMSLIWSASIVSHSSSALAMAWALSRFWSRMSQATLYWASMIFRISSSTFCMVASDMWVVLVTLRPKNTSPSFSAYTMGPSDSLMP